MNSIYYLELAGNSGVIDDNSDIVLPFEKIQYFEITEKNILERKMSFISG